MWRVVFAVHRCAYCDDTMLLQPFMIDRRVSRRCTNSKASGRIYTTTFKYEQSFN